MERCIRCKIEGENLDETGVCKYCIEDWQRHFKIKYVDEVSEHPEVKELIERYRKNMHIPHKGHIEEENKKESQEE